MNEDKVIVPIPDPTTLTSLQLHREIQMLKDLIGQRFVGYDKAIELLQSRSDRMPSIDVVDMSVKRLEAVIGTRLDGMDKATQLLQLQADIFPSRIDEKIETLRRVNEERFYSIKTQFIERDVRAEQTLKDSKVAVDAALQAAKEAVGEQNKSSALAINKSETATTKQIDAIGHLIQTTTSGLNDKIEDIKSRLTLVEGKSMRVDGRVRGIGDSWGFLVGAVGIIAAIFSMLVHK